MCADSFCESETGEAEETVLTGCPGKVCRDGDACETFFLDGEVGFLAGAVFEEGAEPGVSVARDIDGCCGDEVVPIFC